MKPYAKITAAKEFLTWLRDNGMYDIHESTVDRWVEEVFIECDVAVAHGPGHQSISPCENPYRNHTTHYNDVGEWSDEDLSEQTYTKYRYEDPPGTEEGTYVLMKDKIKVPIKTYRLAFGPH